MKSTVDDRLLLHHESSDASDSALLTGALGANAAGCITVNDAVVVLPSADVLLADGGVQRGRQRFSSGDEVRLVGGFSPAIDELQSLCGAGKYFYAGSAA